MLTQLKDKTLAGNQISRAEALSLTALSGSPVYALLHVAWRVTDHFFDTSVDLCSIINAKAGRCSEGCHFCAQSGCLTTAGRTVAEAVQTLTDLDRKVRRRRL